MKRLYIKPYIDIESIDMSNLLGDASLGYGGTGGGNKAESKRTIFASFDLDEPEDNWGDIWVDETEEY